MSQPSAANRLAAESLARGDATSWFERLYDAAAAGTTHVPWDRGGPHPVVRAWVEDRHARRPPRPGERALVVGSGLGDDAELLAGLGWRVTAFDLSPTAVRTARERHPGTAVSYVVADLFDLPADWAGAYDLVVESQTVQSLPRSMRAASAAAIAGTVAPGGTLFVHSAVAEPDDEPDAGPPWPLTRAEVDGFAPAGSGLEVVEARTVPDFREPDRSSWAVELRRAASAPGP